MSSIEQVIENIKTCDKEGTVNSMTEDESEVLKSLRDNFKSKIKVNCTSCKYCLPCPSGVDIPNCFEALNNASMFDDIEYVKNNMYKYIISKESDASRCIECGKCEKVCPQHISIIKQLKETKEVFK
ncbi:MAG: 4Fe-4S dicluster domain-containing protein [Peptostreptococcaceae bacterium]